MQPRDLSDCREYVPGRGADEVARERGIDPSSLVALASNENALGPSPEAAAAVRASADEIHRYPKGTHATLTAELADRWGVDPAQIWLANGGDGALDYLSRTMLHPGDTVLVPDPGFAYYGMSARYHHGSVDSYALDRDREFAMDMPAVIASAAAARILYVTSPHNPTGRAVPIERIETLADETDPETLVVVDEAYGAFADVPTATALVRERDDVAVLRSFSKSYGLAGIRLGYAIVPSDWAGAYRKVNTPFAASEVACRAGLAAIGDEVHLDRTVDRVHEGRAFLQEALPVPSWPSEGNFVLADVGDATAIADALLDRGVLVRDCSSFGLPACIRITVGTEGECCRVVEELNELVATTDAIDG